MMYQVVETFVSINGEGVRAGELAAFIRFRGCNLNCSYCDTRWANQPGAPFEEKSAEQLLAASAEGSLTGIPVKLGDSVQEMTDRYHLLTDPDGFEGGRLFALEGGCFRGVYLMTDDLTRGWENSKVEGIRMDQGCLWGLCVNETMREDWISVLGEPDGSAAIDEEKAEANRLVPGTCDYYSCGEYQLRLYSDDTGCLICIVLTA